jgi:hypothetical protein
MLKDGDIEHVESVIKRTFPLGNCGSWNRIKKELVEALTKAPNSQSKQCQCGCDITEHICPSSHRTFIEVCA